MFYSEELLFPSFGKKGNQMRESKVSKWGESWRGQNKSGEVFIENNPDWME